MVWLGLNLLTQNGRLLLRVESLEQRVALESGGFNTAGLGRPPGSVLNDFALPLLSGGTMTLSQWRGRNVVLIFLNPRCVHCEQLLPKLAAALGSSADHDPAPIILSSGTATENRRFFGERFSCPILLQEDSEVAALYMALATPMGYLVDENGATSGSALIGASAILAALESKSSAVKTTPNGHSRVESSLSSSRIKRDGLKAGEVAPDFTLPTLDDAEISLKSFLGKPLLLVFSDPNCAPCNQILPKLEEMHRASDDLRLLVISRGDLDANRKKVRELGLTLPFVLQKSWEISRDYGMFATPIGYLVDDKGVLAADVAPGGNAILALAAQRRRPATQMA